MVSIGNAAALAEMWYGDGRGLRDLIAFSIGFPLSNNLLRILWRSANRFNQYL